jgi:SAM-dependent methyltransferase
VTSVEPLGSEFDFFSDLHGRVLDYCHRRAIPLSIVRAKGEALNLPEQFDLAFTINALEHMEDPLRTIDNMCESLKPGGVALLHCPNYTVPFEVHFNIWLVTQSKRLNEWLYRSKIDRRRRIWDELTFIRTVDVRRHLAGRGAHFTFNRSVMRDLMMRLLDDPLFAQRMPSILRAMAATLRSTGLIQRLTLVPARFQTPMEVLITNTPSTSSCSSPSACHRSAE